MPFFLVHGPRLHYAHDVDIDLDFDLATETVRVAAGFTASCLVSSRPQQQVPQPVVRVPAGLAERGGVVFPSPPHRCRALQPTHRQDPAPLHLQPALDVGVQVHPVIMLWRFP